MTQNSDRKIFFRKSTLTAIGLISMSIITGVWFLPYFTNGDTQIPTCPKNLKETDSIPAICIPVIKPKPTHILTVKDCPNGVDITNNKCLEPVKILPNPVNAPMQQQTDMSLKQLFDQDTYYDTLRMLSDNGSGIWVSGPNTLCPVSQKDRCQQWYDMNKVVPDDPVFQNMEIQQKLDKLIKGQNNTNILLQTLDRCLTKDYQCKITINETTINETARTLYNDEPSPYVQCNGNRCP